MRDGIFSQCFWFLKDTNQKESKNRLTSYMGDGEAPIGPFFRPQNFGEGYFFGEGGGLHDSGG